MSSEQILRYIQEMANNHPALSKFLFADDLDEMEALKDSRWIINNTDAKQSR